MGSWKGIRPLASLGAIVLLLCCAAGAAADVIVQGKVEVWDEILERYVPARRVVVEVERDWQLDDPEFETDENGLYVARFPDPDDTYDGVDIEVYALTRGRCEVRSSVFSWWPYHVISRSFDDVKPGSTLVLDLRFGKPEGFPGTPGNLNVDDVGYRNEADTAKAFLVHQEILEHQRQLLARQWPEETFGQQGVVVPAALFTSYYNHFTDLINLVYAGFTGMGTWPPLPKGDHAAVRFNHFRYTVRHEYGHALHDRITALAPFGLNIPSSHSPFQESNRWVAYTEGFADFLALTTLGSTPHLWEASRSHPGGPEGLPVLAGDAWAMEGEVTGLLYDLFDGRGFEVVRNPAEQTADGAHVLPPALVKSQVFLDDLEDPTVVRVREAAASGAVGLSGTVETVRQFLEVLQPRLPETHRLKAIAYNRGLREPLPPEHPAVLVEGVSVRPWGSTLTFEGVVHEHDAEDRPFVRLTARHQRKDGSLHALAGMNPLPLATGWTGATRPFTAKATLGPGFAPGDTLWLELNDDMLPRVYRLAVPAQDDGVVTAQARNVPLAGAHALLPPGVPIPPQPREPFPPGWVPPGALAPGEGLHALGPPEAWRLLGQVRWSAEPGEPALFGEGVGIATVEPPAAASGGVRARCRRGRGVAAVLLDAGGAKAPDRAYVVLLHADAVSLAREEGGRHEVLAVARAASRPGDVSEVRVQRAGAEIRVLLDGTEVLRASVPSPLPRGAVGIGVLSGSGFVFDALAALPTPAPLPRLAEPDERPPAAPAPVAAARDARKRFVLLLAEAQALLRVEGEARALGARVDRSLYALARRRGELSATASAARLFSRTEAEEGGRRVARSEAEEADRARYLAWLDERGIGGPLLRGTDARDRARLGPAEGVVREALRRRAEAAQRASDVRRRLVETSALLDPPDPAAREDLERTVTALVAALERMEGDGTSRAELERRRRAVESLRR